MWLRVSRAVALAVGAVSGCRANVYVGGIVTTDAAPLVMPDAQATVDATDAPPGDGAPAHVFRYLHASGAKIVDSADDEVRLRCINWAGFETRLGVVDGLHASPLDTLVGKIAALHFNCIRLPYCNDAWRDDSIPSKVDAALSPVMANPALANQTSLAILEAVLTSAERQGLYVILARHAPHADALQYPVWDGTDPMAAPSLDAQWLADWQTLAQMGIGHPNLVGFDLHDEPGDPSTWRGGDPLLDWAAAAERGAEAILQIHSRLLIVVSGIESANGQKYWPGGNLSSVPAAPLAVNPPTQLVYASHDYGSGKMYQPWFGDPTFPDNLPAMWDAVFGVVFRDAQAPRPVFVASFGDRGDAPGVDAIQADLDARWMAALVDYLDAHQLSFGYWAFNPSAGGLTGLLRPGWQDIDEYQRARIAALLPP
jgi:endoglucanase